MRALSGGDDPDVTNIDPNAFERNVVDSIMSQDKHWNKFKTTFEKTVGEMPPERREIFETVMGCSYDEKVVDLDSEAREEAEGLLKGIYRQYYTALCVVKVPVGGRRHQVGEGPLDNAGYEGGSVIVNEVTLAIAHRLEDVALFRRLGAKEALMVQGVAISCLLSAVSSLTPDHEDPNMPRIMMVEPQVKFLPPGQRSPQHIMKMIEELPGASLQAWQERVKDKSHLDLVGERKDRDGYFLV